MCRTTECQPTKRLADLPGRPLRWAVTLLLLGFTFASVATAQVEEADWVMYHDPELPTPTLQVIFPPGLAELWTAALDSPQRELRRRAASAISQAHQKGLTGLESAIPQLMETFKQPDQDRLIRLTIAQTLVTLDARQAASLLFEQLTDGDLDLAEMVEPALARWDFAPARAMWLARLDGPIVFRRAHVLAIQSLTAVGEIKSLPKLQELAIDHRTPTNVRLAAAQGLGQLQTTGLQESASKLMQDKSPAATIDRLVAANLLTSHRGDETEELLAQLATDSMPSVQALGLAQLLRIDPKLIMPLVPQTIGSPDVNVRRLVSEALISVAHEPKPENIALLSTLLDDLHPSLRRFVRESLVELAAVDTLHDAVITEGRRRLGQEGWRGLEQAIQLLVALDDKTIVDRLLVLLDEQRPEVHVTAAWGLCQLNVPSTIEPLFAIFKARTDLVSNAEPVAPAMALQLSHLAQTIGRMKYLPAEATLRKYIPKEQPLQPISRAAAIWALGHLYVDKPVDELAQLLSERLTDTDSLIPEDPIVRRMSGVTLGRMKAEQSLDSLRRVVFRERTRSSTGMASAWSIQQITGESIPAIEPTIYRDLGFFLVPELDTEMPSAPGS